MDLHPGSAEAVPVALGESRRGNRTVREQVVVQLWWGDVAQYGASCSDDVTTDQSDP